MKQKFQGKTLDEALDEAQSFYQVERSFIHYEMMPEEKSGLLAKLFSKQISIEAWVENDKQDLQEAARRAVEEVLHSNKLTGEKKPPRKENHSGSKSVGRTYHAVTFDNEKVADLFDEYCGQFFDAFDIPSENVDVRIGPNAVDIQVTDPFFEDFLGRRDKVALAFEHVFKRIVQKKLGDLSIRLLLKAGDSDEKRRKLLEEMAESFAQKALKTGKSVLVSHKSAQERKIIHMFLDGHKEVATRSVGVGDNRKLMIYPKDKDGREKGQGKQFRGRHHGKKRSAASHQQPRQPQADSDQDTV